MTPFANEEVTLQSRQSFTRRHTESGQPFDHPLSGKDVSLHSTYRLACMVVQADQGRFIAFGLSTSRCSFPKRTSAEFFQEECKCHHLIV